MDNVFAGKPLLDLVRLCYSANRPVLLSGNHGVGKSELLEQAALDLGISFICRDLSLMEPPDLTGLPKINKTSTVYHPPEFLPQNGRGLLVFEELNRCERYIRVPCLQLLTTRTLNDYRLPTGWLPVAAVNPVGGGYEVGELDLALLSRFVCVQVRPDRDQWLTWARRNQLHPAVIHYVQIDQTVFDTPESNPRTWTYVSTILKTADENGSSKATIRAAVLGLLGDRRGSAFLKVMKTTEKPLSATAVINSYQERRSDLQRWLAQGRVDLVEVTLRSLLTFLQPSAEFEEVRQIPLHWHNLALFLEDLPGDLRESAQSFFLERNYCVPELEIQT